MAGTAKPRVLCVDDEPYVLEGLQLHLRRKFEVVTATSGADGLAAIARGPAFAAIVSDMRMPAMDGAEFLAKCRETTPASVRVLLTGQADLESAVAAVNRGQIFRFLTKPCPPETLIQTLDTAVEHHRLVEAERVLLEQTLTGAVRALTEVLSLAHPLAFGRANRLKATVSALCDELGLKERWSAEVAAQLCLLGLVQLPAALVEKIYYGHPLSAAEQALADKAPALSQQLLAHIPRLEPVREIIGAAGLRLDGPDAAAARTRLAAMPLGARMLRAALAMDEAETAGRAPAQALASIEARRGDFDADVVGALGRIVAARTQTEVVEIPLAALVAGMVLAADVQSRAGVLLVARGYTVSPPLVDRLHAHAGGVREPLKVLVAKGARP